MYEKINDVNSLDENTVSDKEVQLPDFLTDNDLYLINHIVRTHSLKFIS